jgi:hypothetical protein
MVRGLLVTALLALVACGGKPAVPTGGASSDAATAKSDDPAPVTDYDRKRELGKQRREQCEELGGAIQSAQHEDQIVNENNSAALRKIADELEQTAKGLGDVSVELPELVKLRDEYVQNVHDMAGAMAKASTAKGDRDRKKALKSFAEHEGHVEQLINSLNERCNAPIP